MMIILKNIKRIFLSDHIILGVILLNTIIIYAQEMGLNHPALTILDILCTFFFLIEMIAKHQLLGIKRYWKNSWNRMDAILVICSLPSLITPFLDITTFNFSILLTLRLMRVLRFLRVLHFFPRISQIGAGLKRAIRDSWVVLAAFVLIIFVFGMINCSLYREVAPQYFDTPINAIYSVFRIFTIEGWYEIPDTIMKNTSPFIGHVSRLYFCVLLGSFGILGVSFINSVFVDEMIEDNNDDIKLQLDRIERKLEEIEKIQYK